MMPRGFPALVFLTLVCFSLFASGQQQPSAPKPQTPRQALIEIVTGGTESVSKHLTVEVQELLAKSKSGSMMLAGFSSVKPDKDLQAFDSGHVLFAYTDSAKHSKYEVRVDNDDMAGDQDDFQLSIHEIRDGQEQETDFGVMSAQFTVSLKQEKGIWRLNDINVGLDLKVGSAEFFKKTFLRDEEKRATGMGLVASGGGASAKDSTPVANMPPEQVVLMLAFAEGTYAIQHPQTGFTCSLTALAESGQIMGVDRQVATGIYNGYQFSVTGCEGKPAGSFQLTAEPISATAGAKAFCTDATHNLRFSEDGRGASCLSSGKLQNEADAEHMSSWGTYVSVGPPKE